MTGGIDGLPFREIWVCDTEFVAEPGELVNPVCLVAKELRSGRAIRLWREELRKLRAMSRGEDYAARGGPQVATHAADSQYAETVPYFDEPKKEKKGEE